MTTPATSVILTTLAEFQRHIYTALVENTIGQTMKTYGKDIKSFYMQCKDVSGDAQVAWDQYTHCHSFLREYYRTKDHGEDFRTKHLEKFETKLRPQRTTPAVGPPRVVSPQRPGEAGPGPSTIAKRHKPARAPTAEEPRKTQTLKSPLPPKTKNTAQIPIPAPVTTSHQAGTSNVVTTEKPTRPLPAGGGGTTSKTPAIAKNTPTAPKPAVPKSNPALAPTPALKATAKPQGPPHMPAASQRPSAPTMARQSLPSVQPGASAAGVSASRAPAAVKRGPPTKSLPAAKPPGSASVVPRPVPRPLVPPAPHTTSQPTASATLARPLLAGQIRRPKDARSDTADEPEPSKKFRAIEDEESEEIEWVDSEVRKPVPGQKRKRAGKEEEEGDDDEGREYDPRSWDAKGKGKGKARVQEMVTKKRKMGDDDAWESDEDDELEEDGETANKAIVVSRRGEAGEESRAAKPKKVRIRVLPKGTGEYHDPGCPYCTVQKKRCEKEAAGGACVACKSAKRRCEFSMGRHRKKVKAAEGTDDEGADSSAPARPIVVKARRPAIKGSKPAGSSRPGPGEVNAATDAPKKGPPETNAPRARRASSTRVEEKMQALETRLDRLDEVLGDLMKVGEHTTLGQRLDRFDKQLDRLTELVTSHEGQVTLYNETLVKMQQHVVAHNVNPTADFDPQPRVGASRPRGKKVSQAESHRFSPADVTGPPAKKLSQAETHMFSPADTVYSPALLAARATHRSTPVDILYPPALLAPRATHRSTPPPADTLDTPVPVAPSAEITLERPDGSYDLGIDPDNFNLQDDVQAEGLVIDTIEFSTGEDGDSETHAIQAMEDTGENEIRSQGEEASSDQEEGSRDESRGTSPVAQPVLSQRSSSPLELTSRATTPEPAVEVTTEPADESEAETRQELTDIPPGESEAATRHESTHLPAPEPAPHTRACASSSPTPTVDPLTPHRISETADQDISQRQEMLPPARPEVNLIPPTPDTSQDPMALVVARADDPLNSPIADPPLDPGQTHGAADPVSEHDEEEKSVSPAPLAPPQRPRRARTPAPQLEVPDGVAARTRSQSKSPVASPRKRKAEGAAESGGKKRRVGRAL